MAATISALLYAMMHDIDEWNATIIYNIRGLAESLNYKLIEFIRMNKKVTPDNFEEILHPIVTVADLIGKTDCIVFFGDIFKLTIENTAATLTNGTLADFELLVRRNFRHNDTFLTFDGNVVWLMKRENKVYRVDPNGCSQNATLMAKSDSLSEILNLIFEERSVEGIINCEMRNFKKAKYEKYVNLFIILAIKLI